VVFPQQIVAIDACGFSWPAAADVAWVRGDLALVGAYATEAGSELLRADALVDEPLPHPGRGAYYLVRPGGTCEAGSWQTALGEQPGRDAALP